MLRSFVCVLRSFPRRPAHPWVLTALGVWLGFLVSLGFLASWAVARADSADVPWMWPTGGPVPVVEDFAPPAHDWLAGNRGVVLDVPEGHVVVAPAAGRVSFAGWIVNRSVVVVTHDERRSTFEPVTPLVSVGDVVAAGDPIGVVATGPNGPLHWGVKVGDATYLHPLLFLSPPAVLKPWDGPVGR